MGRKPMERFWITFTANANNRFNLTIFPHNRKWKYTNRPLHELHGFSTFDWDQLGKILQHSWKKYLKISSKVVNFESDLLKTNEEFTDIAWWCRWRWWWAGCSKFIPTIIPPSYGLFAESGRVYSVQNSFGSNWCETIHFFGQGMNSNKQVVGKLGHVVQTDVFCLPLTWVSILSVRGR